MAINLQDYKAKRIALKELPYVMEVMRNCIKSLSGHKKYKPVYNTLTALRVELRNLEFHYKRMTDEEDK
jgi:hypothetical protein